MSVNFPEKIDDKAHAMLQDIFGDSVAEDRKTYLFDKIGDLNRRKMSDLAKATGQPVSVELNDVGDAKTVGDDLFRLLEEGWEKK